MRAAIYARVSTSRQAKTQKADEQVGRLQRYAEREGCSLEGERVYLDEGYSGASLNRPGLDALRDAAAMAEFEVVLITAPDRLAQVRPSGTAPRRITGTRLSGRVRGAAHEPGSQRPALAADKGAVAEYERTLIAERMRRGRLAKLRAGQLLPWMRCLSATAPIPKGHATRQVCA
jgi:site-specific DNA recombinase